MSRFPSSHVKCYVERMKKINSHFLYEQTKCSSLISIQMVDGPKESVPNCITYLIIIPIELSINKFTFV